MTASGSINEELHAIDAPKIWLTRLFQPGTAANQSSANQISPSAAIKSKSLADQAFPNHAFLVGTIPHGKSRLRPMFVKPELSAGVADVELSVGAFAEGIASFARAPPNFAAASVKRSDCVDILVSRFKLVHGDTVRNSRLNA